MNICGIIVEYNPFHNGHRYHIEKAKELTSCDVLIAVMSGNYTQRGDLSVMDKFAKTEVALDNGIDIVVELPYIYATQSASSFSKGAIEALKVFGIDSIVFGSETNNLEELKEQYKELVVQITALIEKGLTPDQTAKALIARTVEQIPVIEFQPLIEAMNCFLQKNENSEKNTAVIGMDPLFEQKAALSALKRGDYETAFDFLERRAEEELHKADSTHRSDVRGRSSEQAARFYRALGVLARPIDPEKSFEALKKSRDCDHKNGLTEALLARAYYESGKTKKAENLFEDVVLKNQQQDYAVRYAQEMIPQIRSERTMLHARRIREEYEHRLEETEGRQKTAQNIPLAARRRAEINRAGKRFVAEELRERGYERDSA